MRALVVGADGFVGRWLTRHLSEKGDEVSAIVGPRFRPPLEGATTVHTADVRDYDQTSTAVDASRPEVVYYLAAVSQAAARERFADAFRVGLVGAVHALTATSAQGRTARLLYVSSAHVYGGGGERLTENSPVRPNSVYGAAKAAAEDALVRAGRAVDLEVVIARPFNHIGPGQEASFLIPSLASKIRHVGQGSRNVVTVGSLDRVRDFTDVRDVVRAYRILATSAQPFEAYNVASGAGVSVREVAVTMLELAGVEAEIQSDPELVRTGEARVMTGDASKLEGLGWTRSRTLRETLSDVLHDPQFDAVHRQPH